MLTSILWFVWSVCSACRSTSNRRRCLFLHSVSWHYLKFCPLKKKKERKKERKSWYIPLGEKKQPEQNQDGHERDRQTERASTNPSCYDLKVELSYECTRGESSLRLPHAGGIYRQLACSRFV